MYSDDYAEEEVFYDNDDHSSKDELDHYKEKYYTVYYTKKIQMKMRPYHQKFIFHQLEVSVEAKRDIINLIFSYLIKMANKLKYKDKLYQQYVKSLYTYRSSLIHQLKDEMKALYAVHKARGMISSNFQNMSIEICNEINRAIIEQHTMKLSKLPYYQIFKGKEEPRVNGFYVSRTFRKDSSIQYGDSLHINLPYLHWVRLKDRKGYFTKEDWANCYKVYVKRETSRTYIIFSLKSTSDNVYEAWSAKERSYPRYEFLSKRTIPTNLSRIRASVSDPKAGMIRKLAKSPYELMDPERRASVENMRSVALCVITKDFTIDIGFLNRYFPNLFFPYNNGAIYNPLNRKVTQCTPILNKSFEPSLNVSVYPNLVELISKYNRFQLMMVDTLEDNLRKHGFDPKKYNLPKVIGAWGNPLFDEIYNSPKMKLYRRLRSKTLRKIKNTMRTTVDRMISDMCQYVPEFILVRIEPHRQTSLTSAILSPSEVSEAFCELFFERLMSKGKLLEIPVFLLNEDTVQIFNGWDNCPMCGSEMHRVYPMNQPRMDYNAYMLCTNPDCPLSSQVNGVTNRASRMLAYYIHWANNEFIPAGPGEKRKSFIDTEALPRFYGCFNKYRSPHPKSPKNVFYDEYHIILDGKPYQPPKEDQGGIPSIESLLQ